MSTAQLTMLRALRAACEREIARFGADQGWMEIANLVRDETRGGPDGLMWRNADRVFGALDRRGLIERHPVYDDLVKPTAGALAILAEDRRTVQNG